MDSNYSYYAYIDSLKNMVHRHLTSASTKGLFWPKFYYSWFYTDERTLFNILSLKLKLGPSIDTNDIKTYNLMRQQMIPVSPYRLAKKKRTAKFEGKKVKYEDITWKRKGLWKLILFSAFAGFMGTYIFRMSRLWTYTSFIPLILLYIHDKQNVPYDEIENFYKYTLEAKKTKAFYEHSKSAVNEALSKYDKESVEEIKENLNKYDKTLFELMAALDAELLRSA